MAMDPALHDYGYERGEAFHNSSCTSFEAKGEDLPNGELEIEARLSFGELANASLCVYEVVCIQEGVPHRRRYSYHLHIPTRWGFSIRM